MADLAVVENQNSNFVETEKFRELKLALDAIAHWRQLVVIKLNAQYMW